MNNHVFNIGKLCLGILHHCERPWLGILLVVPLRDTLVEVVKDKFGHLVNAATSSPLAQARGPVQKSPTNPTVTVDD